MLRDIVEVFVFFVKLWRQTPAKERRFLLSLAVLVLLLLAGWIGYSAYARRQEAIEAARTAASRLSMTQDSIMNLLSYRPQTIDEITSGIPADQTPLLKDALDKLLEGPKPKVWFENKVYLESATGIEYHFRAYVCPGCTH